MSAVAGTVRTRRLRISRLRVIGVVCLLLGIVMIVVFGLKTAAGQVATFGWSEPGTRVPVPVMPVPVPGRPLCRALGAFVVVLGLVQTGVPVRVALFFFTLLAWAAAGQSMSLVALANITLVRSIHYQVDQVIVGIVLNVFALGLTNFAYDRLLVPFQDTLNSPGVFGDIKVPVLGDIPVIGPMFFDANIFMYFCYVLLVDVDVALFRTRWGLRVRAVGEHPAAADTVGIRVNATR